MSEAAVDTSHFLSVNQAAEREGVNPETIRNRFDAGKLSGFRDARRKRHIDPASLVGVSYPVGVVARRLNCSAETIRIWFDDGRLTGHRDFAGHRRIDPESVDRLEAEASSPDRPAAPGGLAAGP